MDRLTFDELNRLSMLAIENDKTHYTLISKAVQVGYYNAKSKKQIQLFKETKSDNNKQMNKIDKIKKDNELNFIKNFTL